MEKDYKVYIKDLSVYDLADEFNTQTFIVNDKEKFNEVLLINHFENTDYIERLETQLKKQKEIIDKAVEYIKEEKKEEGFHNYLDDEDMEDLLQILEDKGV